MEGAASPEALAARLAALPPGRRLVAVAGAPGSGKSTLAATLVAGLNTERPGRAAVIPMDGFHYDDRVLDARGDRARKGAPNTFDVGGLRALLERLRANDEPEVAIPVFDRGIEIARAAAAIVPRDVDVLIVEGNYLLLDDPPWDGLAGLFDLTVMLSVPEDVLRARLADRWRDLGGAALEAKLEGNDMPNGRTVRARSRPADLTVATA